MVARRKRDALNYASSDTPTPEGYWHGDDPCTDLPIWPTITVLVTVLFVAGGLLVRSADSQVNALGIVLLMIAGLMVFSYGLCAIFCYIRRRRGL